LSRSIITDKLNQAMEQNKFITTHQQNINFYLIDSTRPFADPLHPINNPIISNNFLNATDKTTYLSVDFESNNNFYPAINALFSVVNSRIPNLENENIKFMMIKAIHFLYLSIVEVAERKLIHGYLPKLNLNQLNNKSALLE
jgi:hypothetical protein